MNQIRFFALREDLIPVLEAFEAPDPLKYIPTGTSDSSDYMTFRHGVDIPDLGNASNATAINSASFLVCSPDVEINIRSLTIAGGKTRFAFDQLSNPDTVTFTPGGLWECDILLHGRVATVSQSKVSQALVRRYLKALQKTFNKVKAFYVGPQALVLLRSGRRLTISAQSPREFDLTPDG